MPTIPLGTSEKLFRSLHRRVMDARSPQPVWTSLDASALSVASRDAHRAEWEVRAVAEYRSMVVLGAMISRFPEVGLPLEVTTAASRLLQDEARHTELCARLAQRFGGGDEIPLDATDVHLATDGLPAHLFVARWTVSLLCIGECSSVALLRELHAHVTDPCVRAVIKTLLRDEIVHDRFGWALGRLLIQRLRPDEIEWLGNDMISALAHYDVVNAGALGRNGGPVPEGPAPSKPNFGVLPKEMLARAFYRQIDAVILPGLVSLGLPARESWARRHGSQ